MVLVCGRINPIISYFVYVHLIAILNCKGKPEWPEKFDRKDYLARPATQSVVMKCETHGYPQPNITWYKNKKILAPIPEKVGI